jgi:hypothetical protein
MRLEQLVNGEAFSNRHADFLFVQQF